MIASADRAAAASWWLVMLLSFVVFPAAAQAPAAQLETDEAPSVDVTLDGAREQLKAGELESAVAMLQALRARGGLTAEELSRAWLLEGMGRALLDDEGADRAFAIALRLDGAIDPGVKQPAIRGPFEAAKASLPPPAEALMATARARPASGGLKAGVRLELLADDLGLVAGVRVDEQQVRLSADSPVAFAPHPAADEAAIVLVDEHGNALLVVKLGGATTELSAGGDDQATSDDEQVDGWFGLHRFKGERWEVARWPWVTLAGAGVAAAGVTLAIVCGALVAIYDRGLLLPPAIDPLFKPAMFIGLGVGVIILVAAGAGIAADQILRHELWRAEDADRNDHEDDGAKALSAAWGLPILTE